MTDKIDRETLLPCPFCGNDKNIKITNERHDNSGGYFIDCPECHASTGLRFASGDDPRPLLIEQWNRRAAAQPVSVPLTDEKIDHTLATTLDEFARTTRGMSHGTDVNTDIVVNSRLRRMFAHAVLAVAGDKP